MRCFNCRKDNIGLYSPKEIYKFKLYFCRDCLNLLKLHDLRYLENTNEEYANIEVRKLVKKRGDNNVLK